MDVLTQFLTEFMKNAGPIGLVPFIDAPVVHRVEDVTSILWYRRGPFQVQLFATPPHYVIPEHTHPHVDWRSRRQCLDRIRFEGRASECCRAISMAAYPVAAGRCFCRCSIGRRVSRRTASLRTTPVRRWVNSIRQPSATVSRSTAWLSRSSPGRMQPEVKNSHRLFSDGRSLGIVRQLAGRLRTNLAAWSLPRNTHARHARGGGLAASSAADRLSRPDRRAVAAGGRRARECTLAATRRR